MEERKEIDIPDVAMIIDLIKLHDTPRELNVFYAEVSTMFLKNKEEVYTKFEQQVVYHAFQGQLKLILQKGQNGPTKKV
ncbi:MAG: hypothetical protein KUG81_08670 [Gammaproteobacteria bacterium]|nr:hypothetical protein [Gammaproteobacteria bacterium]